MSSIRFTKPEHLITNTELRDKFIALARAEEQAAERRHASIRARVINELNGRPQYNRLSPTEFNARVEDVTSVRCAGTSKEPGDPVWKGHVSKNQWYTQYAIMYGIAAQGDTTTKLIELLGTRSLR